VKIVRIGGVEPVPSREAQQILDVINPAFPKLGTEIIDAAQARALLAGGARRAPRELPRVEDRIVPDGPPVRIYWPSAEVPALPALAFFHGGGFVLCDLDTHDAICRDLAAACGCVVVSVDYRRAPEHRYPAALDDADHATSWIYANAAELGIDPDRIGVAGDSAGANLAAGVAQRRRGRGEASPVVQLLAYPMLDPRQDSASYHQRAEGWFVTAAHLRWYWDCYRSSPDNDTDPGFAPLAAPYLGGLAPAVVAVAGLDPLGDEARAYAIRLASEGTPTEIVDCPRLFHGFIGFAEQVPDAARAVSEIHAAVRRRLYG
jgi:acetyl esterase